MYEYLLEYKLKSTGEQNTIHLNLHSCGHYTNSENVVRTPVKLTPISTDDSTKLQSIAKPKFSTDAKIPSYLFLDKNIIPDKQIYIFR